MRKKKIYPRIRNPTMPCESNIQKENYEKRGGHVCMRALVVICKTKYQEMFIPSSKFHVEPFAGSYSFAVFVEDERKRRHGEGDKAKERVTPAEAEGVIHALAAEGKHSTHYGSQQCICGHGTGSVDGVSVDKIS